MEKASYENLGSECSAFGRRSRAGAGCGQLSWGTFHRSSGGDDEPQAVKEGEGGEEGEICVDFEKFDGNRKKYVTIFFKGYAASRFCFLRKEST